MWFSTVQFPISKSSYHIHRDMSNYEFRVYLPLRNVDGGKGILSHGDSYFYKMFPIFRMYKIVQSALLKIPLCSIIEQSNWRRIVKDVLEISLTNNN